MCAVACEADDANDCSHVANMSAPCTLVLYFTRNNYRYYNLHYTLVAGLVITNTGGHNRLPTSLAKNKSKISPKFLYRISAEKFGRSKISRKSVSRSFVQRREHLVNIYWVVRLVFVRNIQTNTMNNRKNVSLSKTVLYLWSVLAESV